MIIRTQCIIDAVTTLTHIYDVTIFTRKFPTRDTVDVYYNANSSNNAKIHVLITKFVRDKSV